jgi:hypothetical protein
MHRADINGARKAMTTIHYHPAPKPVFPPKAPKLARKRTPIARHTRVKRVNRKRKASEFARCYHSRARVRFVKALPCVVCAAISPFIARVMAGRSENAHTVIDGAGRKAGYETIVPLCHSHHRRYDEHRAPLETETARDAVKACAPLIETAWLSFCEDQNR